MRNSTVKSIHNLQPLDQVNILMVDDRPENLLALEAVLASPNYRLVKAGSGEEALKCVLKQDFAVILLDVQMPGLSGFETAKLIKAREKSKFVPIIFITAISQTTEHVLKGYNLGAVDYIFKPFHPETLKLKVQEFVKIHQNQDQKEVKLQKELLDVNVKLNITTRDLQKNEELARVIGETLLDTIITFDCEGTIISVNPAAQKLFGYSMEEFLGLKIEDLFADMWDNNGSCVGKMLEAVAKHKNESRFPVELQIGEAVIHDEHFYVCSLRDITERKQQYELLEKLVEERTNELVIANEKLRKEIEVRMQFEEELRKEIEVRKQFAEDLRLSQEHFYKIFQSSPCLIEIRSMTDSRYLDVNESWLKFTGYSLVEVIGRQLAVLPACHKESPQNEKIHYLTKSGENRQGLLATEIIEVKGESCVLSVITDVTELEQLGAKIARLDRLNLIGEMAAGIAHEIRNPMTTVKGFLELSKKSIDNLSVQYIDLMLSELDRANSIISEFLNLAKNKQSYKKSQWLNPIIEGLYPLIKAEALLADKTVSLMLSEVPRLYLDEKEISQLILNLSLNGLESMAAGGELTIKTYLDGQDVVLEIQDQGSGIEPELVDMIGTPFFTTKDSGTGLGLPICYSVAERHRAVIDLQTSTKGTTFFVRFRERDF
ncbi:PAS domain S-box protein [Neobacillus rhizophilus]|uniref:histidine kinase n=1 Tax=Neobacillus rhizophilus TaxID=2833579 RepID=A0A942U1K9_9BACI|nr:PAS domain S-box protein [Neobacillus rhizophilus]MBS4210858.1 PAS domain S-box protein [Neobacillus rhizophilus]